MIFCTRIWETDQIFAHIENKSTDTESVLTRAVSAPSEMLADWGEALRSAGIPG